MAETEKITIKITNIPLTATAQDLITFFESTLGKSTVYACEIFTEHKNWKSKGIGRVQFESLDHIHSLKTLSLQRKLIFKNTHLEISPSFQDIIVRPNYKGNQINGCVLHVGFLKKDDCFCGLGKWGDVKVGFLPERKRIEFLVGEMGVSFKLEVQFDDVVGSSGWCLDGEEETNAVLFKLKYAPKIYRKISGTTIVSKFSADRYHICKEDVEFVWVRTTDFSLSKSIGQSSTFCLKFEKGLIKEDTLKSFPHYEGELGRLSLDTLEQFGTAAEVVPLIKCPLASELPYEILFQLNALLQSHKISIASVNKDLLDILRSLSLDDAILILQKLHMLKSTCYDPACFVQSQLHDLDKKKKHLPSESEKRLIQQNLMTCHRALITPAKIYLLGPDVESSNYVVKHFSKYASDFLRVSFVDEDWSKLPADAISTTVQQGLFSNPYKTSIYHRILSILRDGVEIGSKRFEFLAFSASQLRSGSVWMFASNDSLKAEDIREWMGCFKNIRSVSKCAARMGQLFSSSRQTLIVKPHEVSTIPDIEVTTDGISYCFSDGIGKISPPFAKTVAENCGLDKIPSAFQIRYGGYKGVIAVDRKSFKKLSLRESMRKFESANRMLNITSWTVSLPCFLNREIVSLLSTLGVEDAHFEAMLQDQIHLLNEMLTNKEAAINVLASMGDTNSILVKMLLQDYEPNSEPYLDIMLRAHRRYQLSDVRSKCRIFVPKGRVLMGCLDETGILSYGQVYIKVTMTRDEIRSGAQSFFKQVDENTYVVVGKVVVTKNPCLHPGDIRVLEAVDVPELEGFLDCLVFPQKGERPHPNECSGGDLDGDLFFACWDENLVPPETDAPMDYIPRRPRIMDHDVTLEEIQKFFVEYMISDSLGIIATTHLVHADREPEKARSSKCLELATLHSMAVDFAKNGAPAEMPRVLKPKEYPDFMERQDKAMYISPGILGKLYRGTMALANEEITPEFELSYDNDLVVDGFKEFLEKAECFKGSYIEKLNVLMHYYGAESEEEILTGNLGKQSMYLERDRKKYREVKDRILDSVKDLMKEVREWFDGGCEEDEREKMASAWYHVSYHSSYREDGIKGLSFAWIVGDVLLKIKGQRNEGMQTD